MLNISSFNLKLAQITNPALSDPLGQGADQTHGGSQLAILMARLYRVSMILGGLALLMYLAWGGINWITAGGDKQKAEQARSRMTNAIIGMAVLAATLAIAELLSNERLFGFDLLSPSFNFE